MNLKKMRVGCVGLPIQFMDMISHIFESVECMSLDSRQNFDIHFVNITNADAGVCYFVRSKQHVPLILGAQNSKEFDRFKDIPESSYMKWDMEATYFEPAFVRQLEAYLISFFDEDVDKILFDKIFEKELRIDTPKIPRFFEEYSEKQKKGEVSGCEEIWKKWKKHN